MSIYKIKHDNLKIDANNYELDSNNIVLTQPLNPGPTNTELLSRNTITGEIELLDKSTISFNSDLQNVGGFNPLVVNPGPQAIHDIKTIQSSDNSVTINNNVNNLDLQAEVNISNLGTGEVLLTNPGIQALPGNYTFKSILAGTNITLVPSANELEINATGGVTDVIKQNNGTGETLFENTVTNDIVSLKTLTAGSGITLTPSANEIQISSSSSNITLQNLSTTIGRRDILSTNYINSPLPGPFNFNSLVAGSNINFTSGGLGDIVINVTGTTNNVSITNAGPSASADIVISPGSNTSFPLRRLLSGNGINITQNLTNIEIARNPSINRGFRFIPPSINVTTSNTIFTNYISEIYTYSVGGIFNPATGRINIPAPGGDPYHITFQTLISATSASIASPQTIILELFYENVVIPNPPVVKTVYESIISTNPKMITLTGTYFLLPGAYHFRIRRLTSTGTVNTGISTYSTCSAHLATIN